MAAVRRFGPPLALMALIYFLSAQPDLNSGLGDLDHYLRKAGHMAVFGALWALWARGVRWRHPAVAAAIAVGYAITDEWHQSFVLGRSASPVDVAIDAAGVALAWLAWRWWRRRAARASEPAALGRQ